MMKNICTQILFILGVLISGLFCCSCSKSSAEDTTGGDTETPPAKVIRFNGSFIQQWFVADWNDARWDKEMQMLKEAGIEYLVYAPTFNVDQEGEVSSSYPSAMVPSGQQKDIVEKCLKSAQKNGVKIFLGLNFNDRWWKADYDGTWLTAQMETGNKVADELVSLYKQKYDKAMYGWYWVWEVDNMNWATVQRQDFLIDALNTNLDHLSQIAPDMPFMMSPFMNEKIGASWEYQNMWNNVFAKTHFRSGDIFSPQDCVGAGGLSINSVDEWFGRLATAVKTKPELTFWGNIEIFEQQYWSSASLARMQKQLEIVDKYVSNIICFAYSHYYSPYVVSENYHKSYMQYLKTGKLEAANPARVLNVTIQKTDEGMKITWSNPSDMSAVCGYNIYKDGTLLNRIQIRQGAVNNTTTDQTGNVSNVYNVSTYNVLGVESERVRATTI